MQSFVKMRVCSVQILVYLKWDESDLQIDFERGASSLSQRASAILNWTRICPKWPECAF